VSYWTAYLKAHDPAEYMAALLTSVGDSKDKMAVYLNECRRMGITVLPPDVNESIGFFTAVGDDIRFGLGAVRNVGFAVVDHIRAARDSKGRFTGFFDFLKKVPSPVANKRAIESLIKAGAFDSLGATRRALMEIHEGAVEAAVKEKRAEEVGDVGFDFDSLFDDVEHSAEHVPDRPEWAKKDKLAFEREMLGLYVSDHPLAGLERSLASHAGVSIAELNDNPPADGEQVTVAGLITSVQHRVARQSGNPYGMITLEDFGGEVSVMFLGKTYTEFGSRLVADSIVVVRGRVNHRDDGITLQAVTLQQPDLGVSADTGPLTLTVREQRATVDVVSELEVVLSRHRGATEVRLRLVRDDSARVFELPHRVDPSAGFYGEVKSLLGPRALG
jgi:DNA polymerase-3 subunit alpha